MANATPAPSRLGWTLVIEASSARGSVALIHGPSLLDARVVPMGASRDDAIFPAIVDVLASQAITPRDLGAIVCGAGPGSFTSLRIAAAVAKGMAHAAGTPLFAVSSLLLAAAAHQEAGRYLVHADALRGERYSLPVRIERGGGVAAEGAMTRVALGDLARVADGRLLLCVPGADGRADGEAVAADASHLTRVIAWDASGPVSLEQWEPAYGRLAEAQVQWEAAHQQSLTLTE